MPADSSDSKPDSGRSGLPDATFAPRHHRTVLFYGDDAFARIQKARVMIIGLGGVGGHAAVNLARSGVGALHLVDFDVITASSLNRSPYAEPADIGRPKTDVLAAYLARVCPETTVRITNAFCGEDTLPDLLPPGGQTTGGQTTGEQTTGEQTTGGQNVDLVLDAIDSLHPKVSLLAWCHEHRIPVIASMGAAGKRDVGAVRTGDLAETLVCPLARHVRTRLKRRGVSGGIPCVWSVEKGDAARPDAPKEVPAGTAPAAASADTGPEVGGPTDPTDHGRQRHTLASQMTIPGVFGYGLAALALDILAAAEPTTANPEQDR